MPAQVLNERRLHTERRGDGDHRGHQPSQASGHQKPEEGLTPGLQRKPNLADTLILIQQN